MKHKPEPAEYEQVCIFKIPVRLNYEYSMNQLSDKYDKYGKKKNLELATYAAMWSNKIPRKPLLSPAKITIAYNDKLDIDNHGFVAKSVIDGIKKYGLLVDDNRGHLKALHQEFDENDGITVTIYAQKNSARSAEMKGKKNHE
ncbi:MAG TPA: hypothetical protein PKL77_08565 [Candidatus Omnitrophota bacterium]|nr:hypothetical protein [Candidatus Omnitrophota bacterium]